MQARRVVVYRNFPRRPRPPAMPPPELTVPASVFGFLPVSPSVMPSVAWHCMTLSLARARSASDRHGEYGDSLLTLSQLRLRIRGSKKHETVETRLGCQSEVSPLRAQPVQAADANGCTKICCLEFGASLIPSLHARSDLLPPEEWPSSGPTLRSSRRRSRSPSRWTTRSTPTYPACLWRCWTAAARPSSRCQ